MEGAVGTRTQVTAAVGSPPPLLRFPRCFLNVDLICTSVVGVGSCVQLACAQYV